jgi:hypothetical protein
LGVKRGTVDVLPPTGSDRGQVIHQKCHAPKQGGYNVVT